MSECAVTYPESLYVAQAEDPRLHLWFALYTTCRHEKQVVRHLEQRSVECFLPLYKTQRKWKNKPPVLLELPLFPGYLFVRMNRLQRTRVLEVPGVLSIVGGTGAKQTPLPDFEIEALRNGLDPLRAEPHPTLEVGQRARIVRGPLAGLNGIVIRKKNSIRVVLTIELIQQSVAIEVDWSDLEAAAIPLQTGFWSGIQEC